MFAEIEQLFQRINPDILGVCMLLAVIFSFATLIAIGVTLIEAVKSIILARTSKGLIQELLASGYTPEEVERVVHGPSERSKFKKWMKFGRAEVTDIAQRTPAPPVKPYA